MCCSFIVCRKLLVRDEVLKVIVGSKAKQARASKHAMDLFRLIYALRNLKFYNTITSAEFNR